MTWSTDGFQDKQRAVDKEEEDKVWQVGVYIHGPTRPATREQRTQSCLSAMFRSKDNGGGEKDMHDSD